MDSNWSSQWFGAVALAGCFGLAAAPGCDAPADDDRDGGQLEEGDDSQAFDELCLVESSALGLEAVSPLGFSAAEVLGWTESARAVPITWGQDLLAPGWAGKVQQGTVTVAYQGGTVLWHDSQPNPEYGEIEGYCKPWLSVVVEVELATSDGAFSERWPVRFDYLAADRADFHVDVDVAALTGSLVPGEVVAEGELELLRFGGIWRPDAQGGTLMGEVHFGSGPDGIVGFGTLAWWGDELELD